MVNKYQLEIQMSSPTNDASSFRRRYYLPEPGLDITPSLSNDGVLLISINKTMPEDGESTTQTEPQAITLPYDDFDTQDQSITQADIDEVNLINKARMSQSQADLDQSHYKTVLRSLSQVDLDYLTTENATSLPTLKTRSSVRHKCLKKIFNDFIESIIKAIKGYLKLTNDEKCKELLSSDNIDKMILYKDLRSQHSEEISQAACVKDTSELYQVSHYSSYILLKL